MARTSELTPIVRNQLLHFSPGTTSPSLGPVQERANSFWQESIGLSPLWFDDRRNTAVANSGNGKGILKIEASHHINKCEPMHRREILVSGNFCSNLKLGRGTNASRMCKDNIDIKQSLNLLDKMIEEPSIAHMIDILQKCRKFKNLECGKDTYLYVYKTSIGHIDLGNYIAPMFVESGSVTDAQHAFDRLLHRTEHSWTSLILGYIDCGQAQAALSLYQKMQEDGINPSCFTLTALLKACTRLKDIDNGRQIHDEVKKHGFERDVFLSSALLDMYAKCGSVLEAEEVFERLPVRNVVCWTALIAGYIENGFAQQALKCFNRMQTEGITPDAVTLLCSLKACSSMRALDLGRQIHTDIIQKGHERDVIVGNTLIDMYIKCGSIEEAHDVFDKLPVQDVVSCNTLIAGYAEFAPLEVLKCFEMMKLSGVSPNAVTFACTLKACGSLGAIDDGRKVHIEVAQKGYEGDILVGNALIDMYAKCSSLAEAQDAFDKLPVRSIESWNILIIGYAENGLGQEAQKCFIKMQVDGLAPNAVTLVCSLKACIKMGALDWGREIHTVFARKGYEKDLFVGNTLVDMYAKCGELKEARDVFDKLILRDIVSWNALITGYAENGLSHEVLKCFRQMQLEGVSPDSVTFIGILKACSIIGALDIGREIHINVAKLGLEQDSFVGTTLIDMYSKCGSFREAREVFDKLPVRNVVSWNALIAGYAEKGFGQDALDCYDQMQQEGISADVVTFVSILKACSNICAIDRGREIQIKLASKGFSDDAFIGSILVDMYAKCGSLSEAREVFDMLQVRDLVSWNSMIRGYAMDYQAKMAIKCFQDMQKQGVKPDATTFVCLLTACSRANLVMKGLEYFRIMTAEYMIPPVMDHYTCMIDLLARSGCFYAADKLLEGAPSLAYEEALTALLSACRSYGELELGLKYFQQLVPMNPANSSPYILMGSIYAMAGRLEEASRIEELRKHAGATKKPAMALIEVNRKVHQFAVGDNQDSQITSMLETLSARMKEGGYVPNLNLVLRPVTDAKKEEALCGHAEKLAIAFGLLHTPQGQTLRVTKNLRMCNDCHSASKIISKIEKREIILRESNWIHHFKDGLCSCGDMW